MPGDRVALKVWCWRRRRFVGGNYMRKLLLALFYLALTGGVAHASDLAITNVSVIDVETGTVRNGQTVIIRDGVVKSVGRKRPARSGDLRVIDARGKYMLPGFWDMGSYALNGTRGVPAAMELMVAHGVVGTRDLGTAGTTAQIKSLLGEIESGKRVGPKVIWTTKALSRVFGSSARQAGPSFFDVRSEAGAVAAVNSIADAGAHYVKVVQSFPESWLPSVVAAARARKLPVMGAFVSSWKGAADAGAAGFDHFVDLYRSTARQPERDQFLRLYRDEEVRRNYNTQDKMYAFLLPLRGLRDERYYRAQIGSMAKAGTPVTTNMATMFWAQSANEESIKDRTKYAYPNRDRATASPGTAKDSARDGLFADLRDLRDAGVPIMTGTQAADAGHELPGATLLDEIIWLTRAGFTPREALAAATVTPAKVIKRLFPRVSATSKVAPNMPADLVLLDANPLTNINNVRLIWATVADGRWIGPERRSQLLQDAAEKAKSPPKPQG